MYRFGVNKEINILNPLSNDIIIIAKNFNTNDNNLLCHKNIFIHKHKPDFNIYIILC
jgi:hypothetical protein